MKATVILVGLALLLLLAACATDEKASIVEQTWDCMEESDEYFPVRMLTMFPTANSLEEAKEQFIYVSQSASLEELKAGCDEACA